MGGFLLRGALIGMTNCFVGGLDLLGAQGPLVDLHFIEQPVGLEFWTLDNLLLDIMTFDKNGAGTSA
jgi:hypothetical protein